MPVRPGSRFGDTGLSARGTSRIHPIAVVQDGLPMVIKYRQLAMAGNLYCPLAIVVSWLPALGGFLRLTQAERRPAT